MRKMESETQRIQAIEDIYIVSPRQEQLLKRIEYCRTYSRMSKEPKCLLIQGQEGAGKTSLHEYYERQHPRFETTEGMKIPVLSTEIEVPATIQNLVTDLLDVLGDPEAKKGSTGIKTIRLRHFLKECETELIILDEFQHFIDRDSLNILKTISDWLKNLIKKARIPIVLMGMPYSSFVLDAVGNEQLKRRFCMREVLEPFSWKEDAESQIPFRTFLKMIDLALPFDKRAGLGGVTMSFRFFCATNGVPSNVMDIIRPAAVSAVERGLPGLSLEMLADAYSERFANDYPERPNPFDSEISDLEIVPFKDSRPRLKSLKDFRDRTETLATVLAS